MTKHTPGPWHADDSRVRIAVNSKDKHIAMANLGPGFSDYAEVEANAQLIAAAPDLLEVCKRLLKLNILGWGLRLATKAAIAKAEGREP